METELQTTILDRLSEMQLLVLGCLLLLVSTALVLGVTPMSNMVPAVIGGLASLSMAAGALLVGLSEDGAGV